MGVIAWDCADDEYRERAYNEMAAEIKWLKDAVGNVESASCPGCGRALLMFCKIGCGIQDCPMPMHLRELHAREQRPAFDLPPLGADWAPEQITKAQERAMAPQSEGGLGDSEQKVRD